jgi:AraC family transcriptional regulator
VSGPASIRFQNGVFALGEFRCPPEHPRWRTVNVMAGAPHVVFPGTAVVIEQAGHDPLVTTRNHVVYYDRDQRYRRSLHDPRGDHCVFVALAQALVESLFGDTTMPFVSGPSDATAYMSILTAVRADPAESLRVEELVYTALGRAVRAARELHGTRGRVHRLSTEREHRALVEDAKALLDDRFAEHDSLEDIARVLHTSPFHLARVFRERTGFPLHQYRTQLRLRVALELLYEGSTIVADVARSVGFKSHSQFTSAFRATFGVPPSRATATAIPARG